MRNVGRVNTNIIHAARALLYVVVSGDTNLTAAIPPWPMAGWRRAEKNRRTDLCPVPVECSRGQNGAVDMVVAINTSPLAQSGDARAE